jgi:hypothetical protein
VARAARMHAPTETPAPAPLLAPAPVQVPESAMAPSPIAEPGPLPRSRPHEIHALAPAPSAAAPAAAGPGPSASAPGSVPDDSLTLETSMIDKALAALGQRRPQEALATVTAYRQQFPHGKLEYEADRAEVTAQLALGQDAPALAVLDRAIAMGGFNALPRSHELWLLRAELLARTGDCAGAVPAFSRLLEGDGEGLEPGFQERAVYGRAICFGKLGQGAESRRALRDYLNRFPAGRFVEAAQDALDPLK